MERREFLKKTLAAGAIAAVAGVVKPKAFAAAEKSAKPMKILILTGSPRRNGNSSALADSFAKGAAEADIPSCVSMPRSKTSTPASRATVAA